MLVFFFLSVEVLNKIIYCMFKWVWLVTFLKSCPAWIVVGLHLKSVKNCDLHFTFDGDVDLYLIFLFNFTSYPKKIAIFLK